jgi:Ankyrin repeats (3 copies)
VYDLLFSRSPIKEQFLAGCLNADEAGASKALAARPNLLKEFTAEDHAQLGEAASSNALPAVTLMLRLGFDVNTRGGEGFTPVASAALRGLVAIVRVLIAHGADMEIRNDYGGTALGSCQWGSLNFCGRDGDYPACAEALLQAGAKVSSTDFGSDDVKAVLRRYAARGAE